MAEIETAQATLEVRTREQLPQDWAMTQNNLGSALKDQGILQRAVGVDRLGRVRAERFGSLDPWLIPGT